MWSSSPRRALVWTRCSRPPRWHGDFREFGARAGLWRPAAQWPRRPDGEVAAASVGGIKPSAALTGLTRLRCGRWSVGLSLQESGKALHLVLRQHVLQPAVALVSNVQKRISLTHVQFRGPARIKLYPAHLRRTIVRHLGLHRCPQFPQAADDLFNTRRVDDQNRQISWSS